MTPEGQVKREIEDGLNTIVLVVGYGRKGLDDC